MLLECGVGDPQRPGREWVQRLRVGVLGHWVPRTLSTESQEGSKSAPLRHLQWSWSWHGRALSSHLAVEQRICDDHSMETRPNLAMADSGRLCGQACHAQGGCLGHKRSTPMTTCQTKQDPENQHEAQHEHVSVRVVCPIERGNPLLKQWQKATIENATRC